jgi:hypothetical protein
VLHVSNKGITYDGPKFKMTAPHGNSYDKEYGTYHPESEKGYIEHAPESCNNPESFGRIIKLLSESFEKSLIRQNAIPDLGTMEPQTVFLILQQASRQVSRLEENSWVVVGNGPPSLRYGP